MLHIMIASQLVYGCLKVWIWLADNIPQLRGRAVENLVDQCYWQQGKLILLCDSTALVLSF